MLQAVGSWWLYSINGVVYIINMIIIYRIILLLFVFLVFPDAGVANTNDNEEEDEWSTCNCPANEANYNDESQHIPFARMAYLISVHNKRTLSDGAYLLKALMETSHPGNTAIILIHVDKRVGISSRDDTVEDASIKNQFLYHDSTLRKYVDACHATPACIRNRIEDTKTITNNNSNTNATTILEVHSHYAPEWSKWSMNDPTIWAMDYLTHYNTKLSGSSSPMWDVFINLSGDTLPVITAQRISQLFEPINGPLGNTNFVTSSSCATGLVPTSIFDFPKHTMKRSHYFQHNIPKTLSYIDAVTGEWKKNVKTPIYFGSQWMALTHDFVEYVIRSMDHPNGLGNVLKETLIETEVLMTDETFFSTILMNSPFKDTIPQLNDDGALEQYPSMYYLRYERMDENNPNAWGKYTSSDPLYDIPPRFGEVTDGEGPAKAWGPYFLGTYDLGDIKDSGAIFVRKVSWTVDENLVFMLPVRSTQEGKSEWDELPDIRWPSLGVKIHDPFIWKALAEAKKAKEEEDEEEVEEA